MSLIKLICYGGVEKKKVRQVLDVGEVMRD